MKFPRLALCKKRLIGALRRYDEQSFTCDICGREVFANERICAGCCTALPWNYGTVCPFCGRRVGEPGVCMECKRQRIAVEKARSCFTHEGEAAGLVLRFKNGQRYLRLTLAELMLPLLRQEFPDATALTFVPMTASAEKKRGYNQSRLLAEELSRLSGISVLSCAEKLRDTEMQKTLGRRDREKNLKGCFRITDRAAVKGGALVIVDDTLTTGSTADELSRMLLRAGAKTVYLLTATSVRDKYPYGK